MLNFFLLLLAFNITTRNGEKISLREKGFDIRNSESIYFRVKSFKETFMNLVDDSSGTVNNNPFYRVHFGIGFISHVEYPFEPVMENEITDWSQHYQNVYVPFWVSWICGTIEAGKGNEIGYYKINNLFMDITDISIMSHTTAHWLIATPKKANTGKVLR